MLNSVHNSMYCILISAPTSTSRYSDNSSEHPLEAKLQELLDAHIALKETVDKAVVRLYFIEHSCSTIAFIVKSTFSFCIV